MRTPRRILVTTASLALVTAGLGACSDSDASAGPAEPDTVWLQGNEFRPETLTVETGTTVTWEWQQRLRHNVVGDDFASEIQLEGTYSHTFDEAGEHEYVCTLHPGMTGTVVVEPATTGGS